MDKQEYKTRLNELQICLVHLQRYIIANDKRLLILLEGRDAAGKDGTIKRIIEHQSPRETRVVALGKPSDDDRTSWYFKRYVTHLPSGGESVLFNRSWYNRAGVEPVMGYCTREENEVFLKDVGRFESMLVDSGTILFKYYLDISREEQSRRMEDRKTNPLKSWKISPVDEVAMEKYDDYSAARDRMLTETGDPVPWRVVKANNKKQTRLTIIQDIIGHFDWLDFPYDIPAASPDLLRHDLKPDQFAEFLAY